MDTVSSNPVSKLVSANYFAIIRGFITDIPEKQGFNSDQMLKLGILTNTDPVSSNPGSKLVSAVKLLRESR